MRSITKTMCLLLRRCLITVVAILLLSSSAAAWSQALFPRPPELEPAVQFWVRVYTEVDTQSGFLHDSQNLSVIYQALPLNRREIERVRNRIREDLRVLASGKRTGLTRDQQEILDLWGVGVSNETLRAAASNVRWQLGQSDRFLGGLIRSGAYREHINRVIREKGLPLELGVLPHVESSFNPGAFSSASAAGMWQFGRATGQRFMRIDHIVDERMDPYIATNAAMSLLEYNYSVLGTWPLALTAYNHGAGGIARAVRETGTRDIETIVANYKGRAFGFASRNFYAQFLAVLEVENRAREHFGDFRLNPAPRYREIELDSYVDAEVFARSVGISLEQLREDNPALRPVIWDGSKRIPRGWKVKVREEAVPGGDLLAMIPDDLKFAIQTPDIEYIVERGDSLSVIASRFNTSVSALVSINQLASRHRIQIGQRLLLPQEGINDVSLAEAQDQVVDGAYTVRRGDSISLIAARYGVPAQALMNANGLQDPHRIYPGQSLMLPGFSSNLEQASTTQTRIQVASAEPPPVPESPQGETQAPAPPPAEPSPAEPEADIASRERVPEPAPAGDSESEAVAEPVELALLEDDALIPPAAVLLDNQDLQTSVSESEEEAVAIDPELDVQQSNEMLTEDLAADPSDYSVASDNTVEIQASETLGHYADWLGIRAWDIRRLNDMAYRDPVIIGKRLSLDFSRVNIAEFERQRREFHLNLQREFFSNYRIQAVQNYRVKRGDNIGRIARNTYSTPIWLLRQYNPGLDFNRIQIDQEIVFPILEQVR